MAIRSSYSHARQNLAKLWDSVEDSREAAVIQNEAISPTVAFTAARDQRYTVVVLAGATPTLRVDGPLPVAPLLAP